MDKNVKSSNRGFLLRGNKHQIKTMQNYIRETFGGNITAGKLSILIESLPQVRIKITEAARI